MPVLGWGGQRPQHTGPPAALGVKVCQARSVYTWGELVRSWSTHLKRKPIQSSPDELGFLVESKRNGKQKIKVKANTNKLNFFNLVKNKRKNDKRNEKKKKIKGEETQQQKQSKMLRRKQANFGQDPQVTKNQLPELEGSITEASGSHRKKPTDKVGGHLQ